MKNQNKESKSRKNIEKKIFGFECIKAKQEYLIRH